MDEIDAVTIEAADASRMDIYLQPHSDDVCFSLGALAHRRRRGLLLTAFSIAQYVAARPGIAPPTAEAVTAIRLAEDRAFAAACGLDTRFLGVKGASMLGHGPWDLGWVEENAARIETTLLEILLSSARGQRPNTRPWLFVPSGIGGHVDHVAIMSIVTRHYDRLAEIYRLGFYEDLHYASDFAARRAGLAGLLQAVPGKPLRRHAWTLGAGVLRKLKLIQLYASQFVDPPYSIERFTPATEAPAAPHEAIWSEEPAGPA